MPEFTIEKNALRKSDFVALRDEAMRSKLIGSNALSDCFEATRGFSVVFTRDGAPQVLRRFPYLRPYLERVLDPRSHRKLWNLRLRMLHAVVGTTPPNAFYLNLLMVPPEARVEPHLDNSLAASVGSIDVRPKVVSVLYLKIPEGEGGQLELSRGMRLVASVPPREGALLHFNGALVHGVAPFSPDTPAPPDQPLLGFRASLVCEQYHFIDKEMLARMPAMEVKSHSFLGSQHAARKTRRGRRSKRK